MPNYENGKIYKLVKTEGTLCYIGSTTQSLSMRKAKHHINYKCWKKGKCHYISSCEIFDDDEEGCSIILLENYPCNSKYELEKRERHYIETITCVNKTRPTRTSEEYYKDNKDKIREQVKKYKELNRDNLSEYMQQYYELNRDKISDQKKKYYKDKLNTKYTCDCGKTVTLCHKTRHEKSKKHQSFIS